MNTNLIIGKTNSGKTTGYMFKEVKKSISKGENLLILDSKEEYVRTFKNELDSNGYNTFIFNLKDTSRSNSYNPLLLPFNYYKKGNKDKAIDLINKLALEIFKEDNNKYDPFWQISASNYFTALVLTLFKEGTEEEINLGSIHVMATLGDKKYNDTTYIKEYFNNLNVLDSIYVAGSDVIYAPFETKGSILAVMKQKLNIYCIREQLLNNLSGNELDLSNLTGKTAIIIIGKDELNSLSNILINQVNNIDSKFTYFLDNFDDMDIVLELNNILEEKNQLYMSLRNKDVLKEKYGNNILYKFDNILENLEITNFEEIGSNNDYPISKINNSKYFNIETLIK